MIEELCPISTFLFHLFKLILFSTEMWFKLRISILMILLLNIQELCGYKILGLFPCMGKSHMLMFESIMEGLALKGHTVHVLSQYPKEPTLVTANYTDLSVAGSMQKGRNPFETVDNIMKYDICNIQGLFRLFFLLREHEAVMTTEAVQKLIESNEKYDLIVTESFVTDAIIGFVHKFNVPFIFVSSISSLPGTSDIMANPQNPAFVPVTLGSRLSPKMNFFERVSNTLSLLVNLVIWYGFYIPANQQIMKKYFGDDTPPLLDIYKNASLVLTNTYPPVTGGQPLAPTVIEVGGVHIRPAKKLPADIEKFIEESPHGVVYFCMGSHIKSATFPEEKKNAFLHTFSKLKERILWKYEEEDISVPANVLIKKWMPQRDILAHPKVKVFISHGGLMGTLEAVSEGKPILGIPIFAEQGKNIRTLELKGGAKFMDYDSINNDTIYEAVQELLRPQYAERAKELSRLFHDRSMSPMDTAVYWIEYVIRNNGTRHLRSPAVDLAFYQYLLIDVVLFLLSGLVALFFITYHVFKMCLCWISKVECVKMKLKSQ